MIKLQSLAQELSLLNKVEYFKEDNVFVFEVNDITSLILEEDEKGKIFISLCQKKDQNNKTKETIIKLLKLFYPTRVRQFFYKVFLLKNHIVISIKGDCGELPPNIIYQFQTHALQCLDKARKGEQ